MNVVLGLGTQGCARAAEVQALGLRGVLCAGVDTVSPVMAGSASPWSLDVNYHLLAIDESHLEQLLEYPEEFPYIHRTCRLDGIGQADLGEGGSNEPEKSAIMALLDWRRLVAFLEGLKGRLEQEAGGDEVRTVVHLTGGWTGATGCGLSILMPIFVRMVFRRPMVLGTFLLPLEKAAPEEPQRTRYQANAYSTLCWLEAFQSGRALPFRLELDGRGTVEVKRPLYDLVSPFGPDAGEQVRGLGDLERMVLEHLVVLCSAPDQVLVLNELNNYVEEMKRARAHVRHARVI